MPIRIINPVPSPEVVKQVVCRNCGVTLEYTPFDTETKSHTDYSGTTDTYRFIKCPKCLHTIDLGYT